MSTASSGSICSSGPSYTPKTPPTPAPSLTPIPVAFDLTLDSLKGIFGELQVNYKAHTSRKTRMIDGYLMFVLLAGMLTFGYAVVTRADPYASFLAAFISCLGSFVFAFTLRLQSLERDSESQREAMSLERSIAQFLCCHLFLFICVANFIA